eukprot:1160894-Amphidinium_carterae.1
MRGDIVSFSQTLNYVLLHATEPGSEAHSITMRVMRQSNGFESWRQLQFNLAGGHRAQQFLFLREIMQPSWTSDTRQFSEHHQAVLPMARGHQSVCGRELTWYKYRSREDSYRGSIRRRRLTTFINGFPTF